MRLDIFKYTKSKNSKKIKNGIVSETAEATDISREVCVEGTVCLQ
jgi:hypothetical protein